MQQILARFSVREIKILLMAVLAATAIAMFFAAVLPQLKSLRAANHEVRSLLGVVEDSEALRAGLAKQQKENDALDVRLHGDMANLPALEVEAYIIGRLQKVSWSNTVELVSVGPVAGEQMRYFQEVLFNVELIGRYDDLYRWLIEARRELGFVVVKEYTLSRHDAEDQEPQLLASLSLASYRAIE